eukprot:TRINITY_DN17411_c0_g1_i1.p1 TRINITY_DN17411_c0_g1~~TRINITY_DN17411_c0_g1_i1.p1  ORF type:complete len:349 (+),score=60.83 TRINITY_DN17411_c0_g1_i1:83-1129(+)
MNEIMTVGGLLHGSDGLGGPNTSKQRKSTGAAMAQAERERVPWLRGTRHDKSRTVLEQEVEAFEAWFTQQEEAEQIVQELRATVEDTVLRLDHDMTIEDIGVPSTSNEGKVEIVTTVKGEAVVRVLEDEWGLDATQKTHGVLCVRRRDIPVPWMNVTVLKPSLRSETKSAGFRTLLCLAGKSKNTITIFKVVSQMLREVHLHGQLTDDALLTMILCVTRRNRLCYAPTCSAGDGLLEFLYFFASVFDPALHMATTNGLCKKSKGKDAVFIQSPCPPHANLVAASCSWPLLHSFFSDSLKRLSSWKPRDPIRRRGYPSPLSSVINHRVGNPSSQSSRGSIVSRNSNSTQ